MNLVWISSRTCFFASCAQCAVALLMFSTSDIFVLINYLSFNQWLWVGVSILGMLWLRYKRPHMRRPIKVPLVFPIIFLVMCLFLTLMPLYASPTETGMGLVILISGVPAYFIFVRWSTKNKFVRKISGEYQQPSSFG